MKKYSKESEKILAPFLIKFIIYFQATLMFFLNPPQIVPNSSAEIKSREHNDEQIIDP
ncbi:MAG: hypothetical protein ACJAZX_000243 [Rickettsiales bacterium]